MSARNDTLGTPCTVLRFILNLEHTTNGNMVNIKVVIMLLTIENNKYSHEF